VDIDAVPGDEAKKFIAERGNNYIVDYWTDIAAFKHWVNVTKPPLNDARVYKALRLLLDHQEAITGWAEVWFGAGQQVSHLQGAFAHWDLTPDELQRTLEWKQPKDEANKVAIDLLSAAGFNRDNPLKFV
jgi:ABC-type transport system substrate-binding protein